MATLIKLFPVLAALVGVLVGALVPIVTKWLDFRLSRKQTMWDNEFQALAQTREASAALVVVLEKLAGQEVLRIVVEPEIEQLVEKLRRLSRFFSGQSSMTAALEEFLGSSRTFLSSKDSEDNLKSVLQTQAALAAMIRKGIKDA